MFTLKPSFQVFYHDYDRLLRSVWQRTSYMARATKSADVQNDLREKALSPDDEELFKELIRSSAGSFYTPLIKWGKMIKSTVNIENAAIHTIMYNHGQDYAAVMNIDGSGLHVTMTKVSTLTSFIPCTVDYIVGYKYKVRQIDGDVVERSSMHTFTIDKTIDQSVSVHDIPGIYFDVDTTDNGLGAEEIVFYGPVTVVKEHWNKQNPAQIPVGDWIEYYNKDGHVEYYKALAPITENEDMYGCFSRVDKQLADFHNGIGYEVMIPHFDANMAPVIDAAMYEAFVCDVVYRWSEIANPSVLEAAKLANDRAAEEFDKAVYNSTPHTHRVHLHYY